MYFSSRGLEFKIPDEWWSTADMIGFVPRRQVYRASPHPNAGLIIFPMTGSASVDAARAFPTSAERA
jgi:hypothetical protein